MCVSCAASGTSSSHLTFTKGYVAISEPGTMDVTITDGVVDIFKCANKDACSTNHQSCSNGYSGALCAVCTQGYYRDGVQCIQCTEMSNLEIGLLIQIPLLFLVVVVALRLLARRRAKVDVASKDLELNKKLYEDEEGSEELNEELNHRSRSSKWLGTGLAKTSTRA